MAKVRWYRAELAGTSPGNVKVRWYRAAISGNAVPVLLPLAPLVDVEPQDVVTLTAVTAAGSATPTGWVWRQVSGPTVALTGTGAARSFEAPSALAGTVVVMGVAGTLGAVTGPEQTVSVTVLPQLSWIRAPGVAGGAWVGSKVVVQGIG